MKIGRFFYVCLALQLAYPGLASAMLFSGDKGNGGDEIGVEFRNAYSAALEYLRIERPDIFKALADESCADLLHSRKPKVLAVEEDLKLEKDGAIESAVALNFPSSQTILVNRSRWASIANPYIKESIALHEYLSLRGLESTGDYFYSSQYLRARNLAFSVLYREGHLISVDRSACLSGGGIVSSDKRYYVCDGGKYDGYLTFGPLTRRCQYDRSDNQLKVDGKTMPCQNLTIGKERLTLCRKKNEGRFKFVISLDKKTGEFKVFNGLKPTGVEICAGRYYDI